MFITLILALIAVTLGLLYLFAYSSFDSIRASEDSTDSAAGAGAAALHHL
jgi:hypothetical protein